MTTHVTIQEAIKLTGKSSSTIRRLVKKLAKTNHAFKEFDQWVISLDALANEYPLIQNDHSEYSEKQPEQDDYSNEKSDYSNDQSDYSNDYSVIIQLYEKQIDQLENQIRVKDEQIGELLERQREANTLIYRYQQQLLLTDKSITPDAKQENVTKWLPVIWILILGLSIGLVLLIILYSQR